MIMIPGYEVLEQIFESDNTYIFRGRTLENNDSVILKVLKKNYSTQSEPNRYRREYEITYNLNLESVVCASRLFTPNNTSVLIFDEFKSLSLDRLIAQQTLSLEYKLSLALRISEALCDIHNEKIIHKNINPTNILTKAETGELRIIDFGIASRSPDQRIAVKTPTILEGNIGYVAPEQTGRMNRPLDYRSDLYSLGATFYELFSGKRPFQRQDTMELIHCHMAKQPPSLCTVNPTIPTVVSEMVMRLMAKSPENRYQSAWGVVADIEQCLTQLKNQGTIHSFPLGSQDIASRLIGVRD